MQISLYDIEGKKKYKLLHPKYLEKDSFSFYSFTVNVFGTIVMFK
jgi:hypothetical protein